MATITASLLQRNPDYIYPLVLNMIAGLVPVWASLRVSRGRRLTQLKYPAEFHEDGYDDKTSKEHFLFNCTQRAHKNLMENFPSFLVAFNVCAASFPRFASAVGLVWIVSRVAYQLGYETGPTGRSRPSTLAAVSGIILILAGFYGLYAEYVAL